MNRLKYFIKSTINHQSLTIILFIILMVFGCSKSENNEKTENVKKEFYTCPMHPQIKEDKPGICPICQMDLVKAIDDQSSDLLKNVDLEGVISINNNKQILANVSTIEVVEENLIKEINAYSYLDFAEHSRKIISARFNGRIERLFINKTGDYIEKGEPLFEIYSPDLIQAQNDFLVALKNSSTMLINSSKKKLELLGLTSNQIKEVEKSNVAMLTLPIYSSAEGIVVEKKVQEGMYINEGSELFNIADLTIIWNIAEINEDNIEHLKIGNIAKLKLKAYPSEIFNGKISFIYPVVNSKTRTIKVRSEFSNLNDKLKPQMYGETFFSINAGKGLIVPKDAVLFMGKRNIVWVKISDGKFEPREVTIGGKYKDKYHILSGLSEGEIIASTGGYLIDSESQLKSGMIKGHQHGEKTDKKIEKSKSIEHKNH